MSKQFIKGFKNSQPIRIYIGSDQIGLSTTVGAVKDLFVTTLHRDAVEDTLVCLATDKKKISPETEIFGIATTVEGVHIQIDVFLKGN